MCNCTITVILEWVSQKPLQFLPELRRRMEVDSIGATQSCWIAGFRSLAPREMRRAPEHEANNLEIAL